MRQPLLTLLCSVTQESIDSHSHSHSHCYEIIKNIECGIEITVIVAGGRFCLITCMINGIIETRVFEGATTRNHAAHIDLLYGLKPFVFCIVFRQHLCGLSVDETMRAISELGQTNVNENSTLISWQTVFR